MGVGRRSRGRGRRWIIVEAALDKSSSTRRTTQEAGAALTKWVGRVVHKQNPSLFSSFSTQIMDRLKPNPKIEQIEVKTGSGDDERDGSKGQSATQQTTVVYELKG